MVVSQHQEGIFLIEIDQSAVDNLLDRLTLSLSEPSLEEWMRADVSKFFEIDIESRFNEEGDVKSGFWPPLSDATINIREQLGYGDGPINVRTGALQEFVQYNREFLQGDHWVEMQVPGSPPNPLVQKKMETATHGSDSNPIGNFGPTPPRPVLAVSEMDLETILRMLVIHIDAIVMGGSILEGATATVA